MSRRTLFSLLFVLQVTIPAPADQQADPLLWQSAVPSLLEQARVDEMRKARRIELHTPCYAGTVSCGQTVSGRVSVDSCQADSVYGVGYGFNGTAGQTITLRASSPSYPIWVVLADGRSGNDTIYSQQQAPSSGGTAQISNFTLPYTGLYFILVSPLTRVTFGDYTLTLTCGSTPAPSNCTENSTTLCLNNNRFRVQATWQSNNNSGTANAVRLTSDTGYLWFFGSSNVEVVIKVLDGCGLSSRYWVFAGGLTNVRVDLTITDTRTGAVKRYSNPLNTAFQPIQDTNAFATCP